MTTMSIRYIFIAIKDLPSAIMPEAQTCTERSRSRHRAALLSKKRHTSPCLCVSVAIISTFFLLVSCGDKGEFAFKSFEMDSYRTMKSRMEFPSDSKTDWLYKIPSVSGKKRYGIIMLKKELVWAEIAKEVQEAEKEKPYLWGSIHGLDPGLYKIMITKDNKLVDENEFVVFDPRTEDEDDDD